VLTDIKTDSGKILTLARSRITPVLLMRLNNIVKFGPIQEPIFIESEGPAPNGSTAQSLGHRKPVFPFPFSCR